MNLKVSRFNVVPQLVPLRTAACNSLSERKVIPPAIADAHASQDLAKILSRLLLCKDRIEAKITNLKRLAEEDAT